jgi:hypothetical protein
MEVPTMTVLQVSSGNEIVINVSDFDPAHHAPLTAEGGSAGEDGDKKLSDTTPGDVSTVNATEAKALIKDADEAQLDELEAAELASVKNPGGRKSVLDFIAKRRAELEKLAGEKE